MNTAVSTTCSRKGCNNERSTTKNGNTRSWCKPCLNEVNKAWYQANPGKKAQENARYFASREGHVYLDTRDGYEKYLGFNHPACNPSGLTRYHRIVLWDKLNGEDVPCTDCERQLFWDQSQISNPLDALHVDHVNGIKNDNRPENLEPVCSVCNNARARKMKASNKEEAA